VEFSKKRYLCKYLEKTRGEGAWVYDLEGNRYLDGLSAYSALNHGHCHPRLVHALTQQAQRLTLTSRAFHTDQYPLLLRRLAQLTGYEAALLNNTYCWSELQRQIVWYPHIEIVNSFQGTR
jgi:acetylornithine/succinyldiaminopimelate/putrescine aminotransferase